VKYHCIIAGDFCGGIDRRLALTVDGIELLNFSISNGFSQVVKSATRTNNCLDLVFSNEPLAMYNVNVLHPFSTSDLCRSNSVFSDSHIQSETSPSMNRLDWNNANFEGISNYLVVFNWLDLLTTNLTADSMSAFSDV